MATASLKLDSSFNAPFFSGAAKSSDVPSLYPVAIDGHPYQIIWDKDAIEVWGAKYKTNALPLLRQQADNSNTPGEQSISPENFWRRSQENFVNGAGQLQQDRKNSTDSRYNSIESRFYTSKGINPWTPYQLSLLNGTALKRASANTGLQVAVNGTDVYMVDGAAVVRSTDSMATFAAVTGGAGIPVSICSDGTTVYTAHGTSGSYSMIAGTMASYNTGTISLIRFVKGRLICAGGASIYNPTTGGASALPAALMTKATGWTWVDVCGGQTQIYMAGYSGDKSLIYRSAIKTDATALDTPIVAGELPDGEIIRSIYAYLGFIVIGSDLGTRFCSVASDGSLQIGSLIQTTSPVYCFEGQDRFVWFGQSNYDSASTGLGRMDMNTLTAPLTPAYATDLMATGQGAVRSVKTLGNYRIFTVDGLGLYAETLGVPVSSGTLTTGWIGYGISDPKLALFLDLAHYPLNGTISASFASDNGAMTAIGTSATQGTTSPGYSLQTNQQAGLQFQVQLTLTPTANVSPKLTRWTLRSYPTPTRSNQFYVPIALFPSLTVKGKSVACNHVAELKNLRSLLSSQRVVSYQEGNEVFQVIMFDYQWLPKGVTDKGDMYGIFFATLNQVTS